MRFLPHILTDDGASRNCASLFDEQLPYTKDVLEEMPKAEIGLVVGLLATMSVWALFAVQLFRILQYRTIRNQAWLTRHVLFLLLFPVVTTCHLLAALVPRAMIFCQFVANFYIAVVLVQFLFQVMAYFGGEEAMLVQLKGSPVVQPCSCCFTCAFCQQEFTGAKLIRYKRCTIQYAIIQPSVAFLGNVLAANGNFTPGALSFSDAYVYLQAVSIVSLVICLAVLTRLNLTTKRFINTKFRSSAKFYAIWIVLLLTNAQVIVFTILGGAGVWHCTETWPLATLSTWLQHFATVYEMTAVAAFAHFYAFPKSISLDGPASRVVINDEGSSISEAPDEGSPLV